MTRPMPIYVLWSAARSRSTAFFRSILERPDLLALHEPLEGLAYIGPLDIASRHFVTPASLIEWLLDEADEPVFLKETMSPLVVDLVLGHPRFLAEARHAFLIRRPEEIAASFLALEGDLRIDNTGVKALSELHTAVVDAGGQPVVVDSDDLVHHPAATMQAYCEAVGLPFMADAMAWEAGVRPEWERTARWHVDVSASTGFIRPTDRDRHGLSAHPDVRRFAERHGPYYERIWAERLRIDPGNGHA
ncbi:MAG: sulfotransferase family protein [Actinomycetota bacterium]